MAVTHRIGGWAVCVALGVSPANAQVLADPLPRATPVYAGVTYAFPTQEPNRSAGRLREVGLWIGIVGTALASSAVEEPDPLECGPCDRNDVPFFDRWAITGVHEEWDYVSTATALAVAGVGWVDVFNRPSGGFAHFGASIESFALTLALTDMLKRAGERRRPFTYQTDLADITGHSLADAKASWPSGHTSLVFAVGTSYWLSRWDTASPTLKRIAASATILTGLLRVPAGRHFPSDVVSGALLGIGSALVVHEVRF